MRNRPLVVQNIFVPTVTDDETQLKDIWIADGKIVEIGSAEELGPIPESAKTIDASGLAVVPSFINAHTHSHFAFGRGYGDLWTLELHLNSGGGLNYGATLDDMKLMAQLNAADMIRYGCTAAYDMVVQTPFTSIDGMRAVAAGYEKAGIKAVVAATVTDKTFWQAIPNLIESLDAEEAQWVSSLAQADSAQHLKQLRKTLTDWDHGNNNITLGLAPSIPLLSSDELLDGVAQLAHEFNVPIQTHLAESKIQALMAERRWGCSIVEHLSNIGFLTKKTSVAHAIWVDDEDIAILANTGVSVAHNPASNMRLGNGVAPIEAMLKAGVNVGIGTDACSCADQQNMFDAMRLASYSSRIQGPNPSYWLPSQQVFQMATQGSAKVLGLSNTGKIEKGQVADLVFLDLKDLAYLPLNNFWNQLVFSDSGSSVQHVMVNGEFIYKDRKYTQFDYDELYGQVKAAAERIKTQAKGRRKRFKNLESAVSLFCVGLAESTYPIDRYLSRV